MIGRRVCEFFTTVLISGILYSGCLTPDAFAQWQVPLNSVPLGRGAGVTGFSSAATVNNGLMGTSATGVPAFKVSQPLVAQAGNAANASMLFTTPNPANGYTTIFNGPVFQMGAAWAATEQYGGNATGIQQALVATLDIAAGDTAGAAGYGFIGYARTNSATTGAVGIGGIGFCGFASSNCWGENSVVSNTKTPSTVNTGVNASSMFGGEYNINVQKKAAGAEPTIGNLWGLKIIGSGDSTSSQGFGVAVDQLSVITGAKWTASYASLVSASDIAFFVAQTGSGASKASQAIQFNGTDAASATKTVSLSATLDGNFIISSGAFGTVASFGNTAGAVSFPSLTASQAVVTDGSKNLASLAYTAVNTASTIMARDGSGQVAATTFTGALAGNATTATTATTATNATNGATVATTTNASFFPLFVASSSNGNQPFNLDTTFTYNPSTDTLTATNFAGNAATATSATSSTTATTATNLAGGTLGAVPYQSGAGTTAILAATATARQMFQSGASAAPAWSTTTWPATTTINRLLWSSAANVISDLATANSSILVTDSGGIPSLSTTLPAHSVTTSITVPLHIGGSGTTGTQLTLQTTTGNGTTDAFAFKGGNNGGTTFATLSQGLYTLTSVSSNTDSIGFAASNTSTGTSGRAVFALSNSGTTAYFGLASTGYTDLPLEQNRVFMQAGGATDGIVLNATGADPIVFAVSNAEVARFHQSSGGLALGTTTDPGAGSLQINANIFAPNLPTTTAALGAAICWTTTTGQFQRDTNAGGCLVSSARYKHDIQPLKGSLAEVMAMRPVSFKYNDNVGVPGAQVGFIAEQMAGVDPRLVGFNPNGEAQSVRYMQLTARLAGAIQELNDRVVSLENRR